MEVAQQTFIGGANLLDVDTALADNQYRMLINGRQRYGEVLPIKRSVEEVFFNGMNVQGGISTGNVSIIFANGLAYYQIDGQAYWTQIADFEMDDVAPNIWSVVVPQSTRDYVRKRGDSANSPIVLTNDFKVAGNPAGIVVQDGINQPWLIEFNAVLQTFVARETKKYSDWSNRSLSPNDREYVPIGRQMMFVNQKLWILSQDKSALYQSVTGRPLDFMVNVDVNGNKLPAEALGGAATVSFNFDGDDITHISASNTADCLIYATAKRVRVIQLNYNNTIFGEPTYSRTIEIEAGVVNQFSFTEVLGDAVFVDNDGVKSFNAVESIYVEGRNSNFSAQVSKLLKDIKQTETAIINHNNYTLVYCQTTLGKLIMVYDQLRQAWVSFDLTTVTGIKQFFVLKTGQTDTLFAVCEHKVWRMYSSTSSEVCQLYPPSIAVDGIAEHKGQSFKPIFRGCTVDGTLRVIEYVDEKKSATIERDLNASVSAMVWPLSFPMGFDSKHVAINNALIFDKGLTGKKISYVLIWDTDAALHSIFTTTNELEFNGASR